MYRKFREDPSSVDSSWHEFLVDYSPEPSTEASAPPSTGNGKAPAPVKAEAAPASKAAPAKAETKPTPTPKAEPAKTETKTESKPKAESVKTESKTDSKPEPAKSSDEDEVSVIRGASAAVVKNMNASLSVPTATSVRAIPAKLMIDNRVVINNHLKRTRGGKISFTHLLGYAIVQAIKSFPT